MYFFRSWFSNMVSFRYILVVLNFLHDIFSIKVYTTSFLWDLFMISFTIFYWWETLSVNVGYWSKSISWKYFIFHEMTLKLYFMKCPERKISQCILPFMKFDLDCMSTRKSLLHNKKNKELLGCKLFLP